MNIQTSFRPEVAPLDALLAAQRAAFEAEPYPSAETRTDWLARLEAMLDAGTERLIAAVSADFGHRPRQETELAELHVVRTEIRHARRKLKRWMKTRRVPTALPWLPGRGMVLRQPLGVVGILSPWNYPIQLALAPLAAALAAGNRVMLKPSELTPRTSTVLDELLSEAFPRDLVAVIQGEADLAARFSALRFDHLFFTGSTATGRKVAVAAARNLVPVTLELGGKSPAIVDETADVVMAAARIAQGKLLNAGQTCIAPDHVLVPSSKLDGFVRAYADAVRNMHPPGSSDMAAVLGADKRERLSAMVAEAAAAGVTVQCIGSDRVAADGFRLAPTIVIDPPRTLRLMQEEIFGPILPIITYRRSEEVFEHLWRLQRPLALYWFGDERRRRDAVLRLTHSGGATVNGTLWHMAQGELPFGGVGESGIGSYHGEAGFSRFSHEKAVFIERRLSGTRLLRPPYGRVFQLVLRALRATG